MSKRLFLQEVNRQQQELTAGNEEALGLAQDAQHQAERAAATRWG